MIIKTYLVFTFRDTFIRYGQIACSQSVKRAYQSQQIMCMHRRAVWTEVLGTVPHKTAGNGHPRKLLIAQTDPGIGLAVLQEDIVTGLILFDQIVLQEKCIRFRANHSMLYIRYSGNHDLRLAVQTAGTEILRHAVLEVLGLAHIDNRAGRIQKTVYTRAVRQHFQNYGYICRLFRHI